ncbi:MAG: hypothetical protein ABI779_07425 [Acidobacteriota bacterium]
MNIQELDQALPIGPDGSVQLTTESVGGLLAAYLLNSNGPLTIAGAAKSVGTSAVTVDGNASLLSATGIPISAVFTLSDGSVSVTLTWSPPDGTTIPLQQVFSTLAPVLPAPPDLTIDSFAVTAASGSTYSFVASMADNPPWTIEAGPGSMTVSSVTVEVDEASGSGASGTFTGTLDFGGDIELPMKLATPGTFEIRANFPDVQLSQLIAQLNRIDVTLPADFDLDLSQAFALIQENGSAFTFSAASNVNGTGIVALTAEKTSDWGYAAGVQLGDGTASSLPGFGALSAIESFVGLEEVLVILSSLDDPGFTFPDLSQFDAPSLSGSVTLPSQANGVVRGVNVYAQLSAANNAGLKLLADYLGVKLDGSVGITLSVSAPDPSASSKLFFTVGTDINGSTRLDGELGVLLVNDDPGAFLNGTVTTSIQGQPATFTVTAIVLPTGVLISGTMQGTIDFSPVTLSNVAIEIGIDEAGVPSLGFAATIDVADFESSIAIFFDSADPSKSMFAGAIDDVTLLSVAQVIAGQNDIPSVISDALQQFGLTGLGTFQMPASMSDSLNQRDLDAIRGAFAAGGVNLPAGDSDVFFVVNSPGSLWHLTDLSTMLHYELKADGGSIDVALQPQIYCAPQATTIGAFSFPQAIRVIAEVDELLIQTRLNIDISPSTGISADVSLAPITLLDPNVFSITGNGPNGGPDLSLSTFTNLAQPDQNKQQPHFFLSGDVHLLGVDATSILVSISRDGLVFNINETAGPTQFALNGTLSSDLALTVGGSATIGINEGFEASVAGVDLGYVGVDVSVSAGVNISVSASGATATVDGSFEFEGLTLQIPSITLDVSGPALANLADTIWNAVQSAIASVLSDASRWLDWVKNGIVSGAATAAAAVGNVLATAYNYTADQIADATKNVLGYTIDGVTQALNGAGVAAQDAANALLQAGYAVGDVATAIGKWFIALHADFSLGHIDTPSGPHVDTPTVPHIDTGGGVHVDTSPVHTDFSTIVAHVDFDITPHIDIPVIPHIDTPSALHIDTQIPPHVDTGTHIDT